MCIRSGVLKGALALALALSLAVSVSLTRTPAAHAYGPLAVYQVGLSFNCDNPTVCGPALGGFWGWAEFDSDNTADAQLTGCQHFTGGGPAGAFHYSSDVQGWFIGDNGDFFIASEVATLTGHTGGPPVTLSNPFGPYPSDTGIPAQPGHYNVETLLHMQAPPGMSIQIQVVRIPNRG